MVHCVLMTGDALVYYSSEIRGPIKSTTAKYNALGGLIEMNVCILHDS